MKQDLIYLIIEAEQSTKSREHTLKPHWKLYASLNRLTAHNICIFCNKEVHVNTNPLPNQIDIGGEAVALNCEKENK